MAVRSCGFHLVAPVICSAIHALYLRRPPPRLPPPPPPRLAPPPPREDMLDEPRLLLLRALDPSYPREPPPNASRFPPPLRERSRLPMRSGPPPSDRFPAPGSRRAIARPRAASPVACAPGPIAGQASALAPDLLPRALLTLAQASRRAPFRQTGPPWRGPYKERRRDARDCAANYCGCHRRAGRCSRRVRDCHRRPVVARDRRLRPDHQLHPGRPLRPHRQPRPRRRLPAGTTNSSYAADSAGTADIPTAPGR